MGTKCTIKDIAKDLNVSRNTISKVLNDKPGVSADTKRIILEKIREMNYRNFLTDTVDTKSSTDLKRGSILFLTSASVNNSDFWINVMRGIESVLDTKGYDMVLGIMNASDMNDIRLPAAFTDSSIDGVIVVEVPSIKVCDKLISYGIPTVFVDPPCGDLVGNTDIVLMENKQNIRKIIRMLAEMGHTDFAFAGEACTENVGMGFRERYEAVISSVLELGLTFNPDKSFLKETSNDFLNTQNIINKLKLMDKIPTAFICGNDLTAIRLMKAIKSIQLKVPEDVVLVGFDNVQDSKICNPPLTTINIPKEYIGEMAAKILIKRIENPNIPFEFSQYSTTLILRQSTGHVPDVQ